MKGKEKGTTMQELSRLRTLGNDGEVTSIFGTLGEFQTHVVFVGPITETICVAIFDSSMTI